jgi:hypothetical protein
MQSERRGKIPQSCQGDEKVAEIDLRIPPPPPGYGRVPCVGCYDVVAGAMMNYDETPWPFLHPGTMEKRQRGLWRSA